MTDKDPNDMTASELLRLAAGEECQGRWSRTENKLAHLAGLSDGYIAAVSAPSALEIGLLKIADKIDAELAQARRSGLERAAKSWAKANGWPDFRDGEDFGQWLDRCAIPRPRFEDGEPVQFGDDCKGGIIEGITVCSNGRWRLENIAGELIDCGSSEQEVRRPAPEVLGADGLPIKVGETVYRLSDGERLEVLLSHGSTPETREYVDCCGELELPSNITHTPPDTQDRIDDDATMPPAGYCAVRGIDLGDDPDWETATVAMVRDLLRRQRELDKRKGGAE